MRVKISWVKWEDMCRSVKEGGLGVKDSRLMNLDIRWKMLKD